MWSEEHGFGLDVGKPGGEEILAPNDTLLFSFDVADLCIKIQLNKDVMILFQTRVSVGASDQPREKS